MAREKTTRFKKPRGRKAEGDESCGKLVHYSLQASFFVSLLDDCARHVTSGEVRA